MNASTDSTSIFSRRLETTARVILLAVVFLLPLAVLPTSWLPLPVLKMGVLGFGVLIALILWVIARLNEHRVEIPSTKLLWAPLVLALGYGVAALISGDILRSFVGFGFERDTALAILTFAAAFGAVALTTREVAHFMRLQQAAVASFLILGVFQLVRIAFGGDVILPSIFSNDATATALGSWHDLAVFAGLALTTALAGLALFSSKGKKLLRATLYIVALVALALLVIVNLSAVWATLVITTFLLAIFIFSDASYDKESGKFKPRVPWTRLLPSVIVIGVSVVFLVSGAVIGQKIGQVFDVGYADIRPSWEGTVSVGASVLKENALFGVGPNMFKEAWMVYKPQAVNETNFWNTDFAFGVGIVPTAFITGGLVVGVLWVLFFVSFIHLGVRMLAQRIKQPAYVYIVMSTYVGAVYLWIVSIVYVPQTVMFAYAFILTGGAIAAARIAGLVRTREIKSQQGYTSGLILTGTLLITAVVAFGAFLLHAERVLTGSMLTRAVLAANEGNLTRGIYIAQRASFFTKDPRGERLRTNIGIAEIRKILTEESDDPASQQARLQAAVTDTISSAQRAIRIEPNNYQNWVLIGDIYARLASIGVEGAYDSAVTAYEEAMTRNPKSPSPLASLARLALAEGNLVEAKEFANEALTLKSNYTDAYFLLSQIAIREGNTTDAIQSTESAVLLQPGNIGLLFQLGVLHYDAGNYAKVIPVLERAVAVNPEYANALYYLGLAYDHEGKPEAALGAFTRIAELNPDNEQVKVIIKALSEGKSAREALGQETTDDVFELEALPVSERR